MEQCTRKQYVYAFKYDLEDETKRTKTMVAYIQICSIDIYLEVMQMSQLDGSNK